MEGGGCSGYGFREKWVVCWWGGGVRIKGNGVNNRGLKRGVINHNVIDNRGVEKHVITIVNVSYTCILSHNDGNKSMSRLP